MVEPATALEIFDEEIDFSLDGAVPDPVPFDHKLRDMLDEHASCLTVEQQEIGDAVLQARLFGISATSVFSRGVLPPLSFRAASLPAFFQPSLSLQRPLSHL